MRPNVAMFPLSSSCWSMAPTSTKQKTYVEPNCPPPPLFVLLACAATVTTDGSAAPPGLFCCFCLAFCFGFGRPQHGATPLLLAAMAGNVEVIKILASHGANPNSFVPGVRAARGACSPLYR